MKILNLFLSVLIMVVAGLVLPEKMAKICFEHSAYYLVAGAFISWVGFIFYAVVLKFRRFGRRDLAGLILSLVAVIFVFILCQPRFKILADEANLLGTSMMMFESKRPHLPLEKYLTGETKVLVKTMIDKRPLLYPYVLSLIHGITGYRPGNSFVVNFIASVGVLYILFLLSRRLFGFGSGLLSVVIAAGFPVFMWTATSGGFEMLNLFYWILTLDFCDRIARADSVKEREFWVLGILLTLVLLGQCRYESILILVVFSFVFVRILWEHADSVSRISPLLALLLLPIIWQRRLLSAMIHMDGVRVGLDRYEVNKNVFRWIYLLTNGEKNIFVMLGVNPDYGFSPLISLGGVAGGYLLLRKGVLRWKNAEPIGMPMVFGAVSALVLFIVISSYYWGNFTLPTNNRLSLVFLPFVVLTFLYSLHVVKTYLFRGIGRAVTLFILIVHVLFMGQLGHQEALWLSMDMPGVYQRVISSLEKTCAQGDKILIICDLPNLYVAYGYDSMSFPSAGEMLEEIVSSTRYDNIIVIQGVLEGSGILKRERLGDFFLLKPIMKINVNSKFSYRISEVGV